MFETMILLVIAPLAISVVPHFAGWLREQRLAARRVEWAPVYCWSTVPARRVTKGDLVAAGYSVEAIDSVRRVMLCARKAKQAQRKAKIADLVEVLKMRDAVKAMKRNARALEKVCKVAA
jgi:hypothetical protein